MILNISRKKKPQSLETQIMFYIAPNILNALELNSKCQIYGYHGVTNLS